MQDRKDKRRNAIRKVLPVNEPKQLGLFEVSDRPLREALFGGAEIGDQAENSSDSVTDSESDQE